MNLSSAKNFDFKNMQTQWAGYISSFDKTNLAPNIAVEGSKNVYKKLSGTFAVRPGQKRRGVANSALSAVSSEFVWNTSWASTYNMTVSDGKLWVVADDIWYPLLTTTQTRYVFDKWWNDSLKKDQVIFVNGTDDLFMWSGGFGLLASATANTIVLDRTITESFLTSASGTVVVNGTTYTYTGSAGSTLTGVTPSPAAEPVDSGVLQSVVTTSNKPNSGFLSDFLKIINNQVYVGSYTSRLIYISDDTDYTNYTVPSDRGAGDPEIITLDGVGMGIAVRQGQAYVGFGSGSWAAISFTDIAVGTNLINVVNVDVKPVAIGQAPYAHEFIDTVGDNIIYLAQDQQVRFLGSSNDSFTTVYPSLSQEIATELSQEDFTGGSLRCIGEFTYVCAPNTGTVYLYQVRNRIDPSGAVVAERLWHSPFIWNVTAVDDLNGEVVGYSNANPQIYDLWDTGQYYDDSPSDEELPYECVLALSYRGVSRRQGLWSFDKVFTEGYMDPGTTLTVTVNYNYDGSESQLTQFVNSLQYPATFLSMDAASLGDESLGESSLGSGGEESDILSLPKFKVINQFSLVNCFEFQEVYTSNEANANWEILAVGSNEQVEAEQSATFLINQQ